MQALVFIAAGVISVTAGCLMGHLVARMLARQEKQFQERMKLRQDFWGIINANEWSEAGRDEY